MPRGQPITWTREQLEQIRDVSGSDNVAALAAENDCAVNTIYSLKSRIAHEGIEAILDGQNHRYERYTNARQVETLGEQLAKIYNIHTKAAGRGANRTQFAVTLPSRVGEAWVAKWGRQVRFEPTEDGLFIHPVAVVEVPTPPSWLNGSGE